METKFLLFSLQATVKSACTRVHELRHSMPTTLLKWFMVAALFGGLFWCSTGHCVALLVAIWAVATLVLVYSNLDERFSWIPVLLALAGLFGSILILAIPGDITLAINEAILITFLISVEVLKKERRSVAFARH
jgi:hypothetical protein